VPQLLAQLSGSSPSVPEQVLVCVELPDCPHLFEGVEDGILGLREVRK
jgi:hypothetical protein